ncbi:MAG TPA: CADD family putative folate metabolism protein [Bryobacteraceae bacterium]|nr:CADD family putative folate metabolism protein [Bryobacteraceae bacterium]
MNAPNSFINAIDDQVNARRILLHPFYQRWTAGLLSREALADYATQYYHHVAAFPTYLSAVHANTGDGETRREILANLVDEEAGNPNHPELWLRFAEGVGVDREDARRAELWGETRNLITTFRSICRNGSTAEGLAALYAYESQIPAVAESKIEGLKKHYGIDSARTLAYFDVHIQADKEHAAVEQKLLARYVDESNAEAVEKSVAQVLDALWEMLSGVERRHPLAA